MRLMTKIRYAALSDKIRRFGGGKPCRDCERNGKVTWTANQSRICVGCLNYAQKSLERNPHE